MVRLFIIVERLYFRVVSDVSVLWRSPDVGDLKNEIMTKAHHIRYSMHLGSTKMYQNIKNHYWFNYMKRDSRVCLSMPSALVDKGKTLEASKTTLLVGDARVEMG